MDLVNMTGCSSKLIHKYQIMTCTLGCERFFSHFVRRLTYLSKLPATPGTCPYTLYIYTHGKTNNQPSLNTNSGDIDRYKPFAINLSEKGGACLNCVCKASLNG